MGLKAGHRGFALLKAAVAALPFLGMPAQAEDREFSGAEIRAMFFSPQDAVSYPVCRYNGQDATYREVTTDVILHGHGHLLAFTNQHDGQAVITVDRDMLSSVAPVFRDFVLAHECAHLQGGHVDAPSGGGEAYRHNEDEADCEATARMKQNGLTTQDLSVIEAHNRALIQAFFPAAAKRGEAERRNAHIRACYEAAPEALRLSSLVP
jgi:hypothetical protein